MKPIREQILEELKTQDGLRKSILEELSTRSKFQRFFEQPAILLILGSLLTGGVGTGLSYYWQSKQKEREQELLTSQKAVEQQYQITNDIAQFLGQAHASTLAVLAAIQRDDDSKRAEELGTVTAEWRKTKLEARVRSSVLMEQLSINFGPEAKSEFQDILTCYQHLNQSLSNMAEVIQANKGRREKDMEEVSRHMTEILNAHINGTLTERMMSTLGDKLNSKKSLVSEDSNSSANANATPIAVSQPEANASPSPSPNPLIDPCRFNVHYENPGIRKPKK